MDTKPDGVSVPGKFESILQVDVPKGRDGKHKQIVLQLLDALENLQDGSALKIGLAELPDSKENIRSALSRATKQRNLDVATSSDDHYLYVWKTRRENITTL
jgi:TusA-related sulfurtransferase